MYLMFVIWSILLYNSHWFPIFCLAITENPAFPPLSFEKTNEGRLFLFRIRLGSEKGKDMGSIWPRRVRVICRWYNRKKPSHLNTINKYIKYAYIHMQQNFKNIKRKEEKNSSSIFYKYNIKRWYQIALKQHITSQCNKLKYDADDIF